MDQRYAYTLSASNEYNREIYRRALFPGMDSPSMHGLVNIRDILGEMFAGVFGVPGLVYLEAAMANRVVSFIEASESVDYHHIGPEQREDLDTSVAMLFYGGEHLNPSRIANLSSSLHSFYSLLISYQPDYLLDYDMLIRSAYPCRETYTDQVTGIMDLIKQLSSESARLEGRPEKGDYDSISIVRAGIERAKQLKIMDAERIYSLASK